MSPTHIRRALVAAALLAYGIACVAPALNLEGRANAKFAQGTMTGAEALLNGCFGMPYAWIANPLALVALAFLKRRRLVALGCAVAALLASQSTWFIVGTVIWGDEAGVTKNYVASLGVGFYLWSLSFLLLGAAALMPVPKPVDAADD